MTMATGSGTCILMLLLVYRCCRCCRCCRGRLTATGICCMCLCDSSSRICEAARSRQSTWRKRRRVTALRRTQRIVMHHGCRSPRVHVLKSMLSAIVVGRSRQHGLRVLVHGVLIQRKLVVRLLLLLMLRRVVVAHHQRRRQQPFLFLVAATSATEDAGHCSHTQTHKQAQAHSQHADCRLIGTLYSTVL